MPQIFPLAHDTLRHLRRFIVSADENGVIRFNSPDIHECRLFLRYHGLDKDDTDWAAGWANHNQTWEGIIEYAEGTYSASAWKIP